MRSRREEGHSEPDGDLGPFLQSWSAPAPPPEIEDDLRRTFRRRRRARKRRPLVWLSLAAGLALIAILQWERPGRPVAKTDPTPAAGGVPSPTPLPSSREAAGVALPRLAEAPSAVAPPPPSRGPHPALAPRVQTEETVVVEPGQAELLAALGRRLQGGISPGAGGPVPAVEALSRDDATIQPMPKTDVPAYRGRWETRPDEWPRIERPAGGR